MPKTNADYQREHRQRRARHLAALEERCAALEAERDRLRADLDAVLGEAERLTSAHAGTRPPRSTAGYAGPAAPAATQPAPAAAKQHGVVVFCHPV